MTAEYDFTVIGGGIHGVGVAQAAAAAGYKVVLLEQSSLAAGTSSKSSKLIHGGLRYLESFEFKLVRESLSERTTLLRIAPNLVHYIPFYIPIYKETKRRPWQVRAGLTLYSLLAGFQPDSRFSVLPKSRWKDLDGLRTDGLQQVFQYNDAQTDDALLTQAVMKSAMDLGAQFCCPAEFRQATRIDSGYRVNYFQSGKEREHTTNILVNAAGPWVNDTRSRVLPEPPGIEVDLVQGTHIELPGQVARGIYYTEAPSDQRAVFTMPWKGHTLVGTTEHFHEGDPASSAPTAEEVEYLRETYLAHFPQADATVLHSWAGLRVLPRARGSAFKRTRETIYRRDNPKDPHYIAIYGGKLTGYRAAAEKVMERVKASLPARESKADTRTLEL
ncbi:MAG: glycerol-3-phosphate dehydrogenase [Planctomycetota bacterium]